MGFKRARGSHRTSTARHASLILMFNCFSVISEEKKSLSPKHYIFKPCFWSFLGFRLVNTKCMVLVDMWKKIQHSNIVTLREVFTTKAFGEHCKFFVFFSPTDVFRLSSRYA